MSEIPPSSPPVARPARPLGDPLPRQDRGFRAPGWLQVALIIGLLASAGYVATEGRYLWCTLLAVAGMAFGGSYLLRRMVGDEYDRS